MAGQSEQEPTEDAAVSGATEVTKREGGGERSPARERNDAPEPLEPAARLSRGTLVGRYVVLDVLGEGGMGVVYSAFDPELDRKVAIKLLQVAPGGSSGGEQAWLVREAQALARLSHPNVVAVHDVGTLPGDCVFVAMELVDGETLRGWLKTERSWRDVLAVMKAAGTGLAAAHAAGLVHRDFKPDNVLVGKDGRVRVMDFGLARLRPDDDERPARPEPEVEARSPLSERLTMAGVVVGTPAYMAPEIYTGTPADVRTDQFAFGVTFYEALFRARPYDKGDLQSPASPPRPRTPPDLGVPAPVRNVVMRAISIASEDRYPTMDALLADLAIDPARGRRRAWIAAGATVVVGALAAGAFYVRQRPALEPCTGIDQRVAGVWDAAARKKVRAAFDETKLPFAARSFDGLDAALGQYAKRWSAAAIDSCRATRVRAEQTEDTLSLRQGCFDQRLDELRALVGALGESDRSVVEKGSSIVTELEPLEACSNIAVLREPGQPPPEIRADALAVTKQLAEAKALGIVGKYLPGLVITQRAYDAALKIGWAPLVAEAQGIRGGAFTAVGSYDEAAKAFADSANQAMIGKRDDQVADAALSSALLAASGLGRPGEAKIWLGIGLAATRRIGSPRRLELRIHEIEGVVLAEAGDVLGAVTAHEKAFELAVREYGREGLPLFTDELALASTLTKAFAFTRAVPHYEHGMALREALVGPDHTDIAMTLSNLGFAYRALHEDAKARAALERALAIRERVYGKNSPLLVATLDNMTDVLRQSGDLPGALATVERAQRLCEIVPGKDHPNWHQVATDHAEVLGLMGRRAEAHALFDEVLAREQKTSSTVLPVTLRARAELALAEQAWADAATFAQQSIAGFEAAGGKDNPELWRPLAALSRAEIGRHQLSAAAPPIARALEIAGKIALPEPDLGPLREIAASLHR